MDDNLGGRLKDLRNKYNYTQNEIGEFLGITQSHLAKIESNDENLNLTKLLKVCDLFNVSEEYLLYGTEGGNTNKATFRKDNEDISLETIARMNRIINNLHFMNELSKEHYAND